MANEAFALSPMSARAAEPNEQDYDAIREAFMETARGRWFLGEYAKRNRNADTSMVLDAVAKIEETLAAQRQPVVEDRLPAALVAIRRAIEDAECAAGKAFDPAAFEASLAPIPRGVRIIKEISWRWREIGADGRICDLIDSQLASIEAACAQISTIDPRGELKAAFDLLKDRVEQTDADSVAAPQAAVRPAPAPAPAQATPPVAEAPIAEAPAAMASEAPVAFTETPQNIAPEPEAAADVSSVAEDASGIADAAMVDVAIAPEIGESAVEEDLAAVEDSLADPASVAEITDEFSLDAAAEAEDDAVLARIAMEMAAPDPEFDEIVEPTEMETVIPEPMAAEVAKPAVMEAPIAPHVEELVVEEPVIEAPIAMESLARLTDAIAEAAAEVMEQPAPAMAAAANFGAAPTASLPMPSPLSELSLGATVLASGIVQKPRTAANDALAPIRRMTQAEKIAFFS
ncbi:hypothetical protein QWJ07_11465 [Frankia sp. RB7]|nr:hypothetical protein [Frankia sp. RB7]